jgi:hypothetical protein
VAHRFRNVRDLHGDVIGVLLSGVGMSRGRR